MTRPVDSLIATFTQLRPVLMETIFGDAYQIRRDVPANDGYGGQTPAPRVVESGWCALDIVHRLGHEQTNPTTVISTTIYTATMPVETVLLATDTLIVNGRVFRVTDVKHPGLVDLFVEAQLLAEEGDV